MKAIKEYQEPKDVTELRRFLGMIFYYRRSISGFSDTAHPLNRIKFEWDQNCQASFQTLKEQLISSPILVFPATDRDYTHCIVHVHCIGIRAVLTQLDEQGTERVISYASKAFSASERNWTTTEKEAFAVVWGLQYFHPYVYGRQVKVFTDHKALQWLKEMKHPNGKLARWIMKLQEYEYTVQRKPSSLMQHADALSRATNELRELQDLDEDISKAKRWVSKGSRPRETLKDGSVVLHALYNIFDSLCIENHLFYRTWEDAVQKAFYWPGFFKNVHTVCPRFY